MSIQKFINQIAKVLNQLKIPYIITGGIAVSIWGKPRHTADVDIVVQIKTSDKVKELIQLLEKAFPKSYPDKDLAINAFERKSEFNVIESEYGFKADFFFTKNDHQEEEIRRGKIQDIDGKKINFISPEDLIISKLLWFREGQSTRQLEDIRSVMDIQKKLDNKYLIKWIEKLDLQNEWKKIDG